MLIQLLSCLEELTTLLLQSKVRAKLNKFNKCSIGNSFFTNGYSSFLGVKVYLNGKRLPVKSFKDYVDFFLKDTVDLTGNQIKCISEKCGERWEVAIAPSDNGFQQMSFVNSIATTKGGRHTDHVSKLVENALTDVIKKKNKGGVQIKPHQVH